jgi:drug/metabolite transporter (DMT)-like permease
MLFGCYRFARSARMRIPEESNWLGVRTWWYRPYSVVSERQKSAKIHCYALMEPKIFLAVLFAALLHACWNGLVKHSSDKFLAMSHVVLGHAPLAGLAVLMAPALDFACWPYLCAGAAFHLGYQLLLLNAYRLGDLSQVYPIARGIAPLIVMAISVTLLGASLLPSEMVAILVIVSGILSLALVRRADGLTNKSAVSLAMSTGCFIAGYSISDGLGARVGQSPIAFYGWLSLINAAVWIVVMQSFRKGLVAKLAREGYLRTLFAGSLSFLAYAIVVWAFTQAPIAAVMALRETSIVFALLIGVFVLKERLDLIKLFSIFMTLVGAVLLRVAR